MHGFCNTLQSEEMWITVASRAYPSNTKFQDVHDFEIMNNFLHPVVIA